METKFLRDYQYELSKKGVEILSQYHVLYLMMQVRTGKTAVSMEICKKMKYKQVLFVTKKKAIKNIYQDYEDFQYNYFFSLKVINHEQLQQQATSGKEPEIIIMDEAHVLGSFPKPNKLAQLYKIVYGNKPVIFLSGTPHPESISQIFHAFSICRFHPWARTDFYKWFKQMGCVKLEVDFGYGQMWNYKNTPAEIKKWIIHQRRMSKEEKEYEEMLLIKICQDSEEKIRKEIEPYCLNYSQNQAGFKNIIDEEIISVPMDDQTQEIIMALKTEHEYNLNVDQHGIDAQIIGTTPALRLMKIHQVSSGTVIVDQVRNGVVRNFPFIFNLDKAKKIEERFSEKKIAIFYKYQAEYNLLFSYFKGRITNDLETFNNDPKMWMALQLKSGSQGISLRKADCLVYYNIDFSALVYLQSRDRMTTSDSLNSKIYFIFRTGGIERYIYQSVTDKMSYTTRLFLKDYDEQNPIHRSKNYRPGRKTYHGEE
jgi:hypothetical protein